MAFDYLIDRARKEIWCTPDQDLQHIVSPTKLTPFRGVFNQVTIQRKTIKLPKPATRFHVYQIGQLYAPLMGLFPKERVWISLADNCNIRKMIADVYNADGVQMPRSEVWYMITESRNLILAVKEQPTIPFDLDNQALYFRAYSNAYFSSIRYQADINDYVYVAGGVMGSTADILDLQTKFNTYSLLGTTYAFVNGYKVSSIDLITTKIGDVAEFVYDGSIYKVVDFKFTDLRSFTSTLDSEQKYLLHYQGPGDNTIDYYDDIDFWICKNTPGNRNTGIYYHKNQTDAVRMLTHRDYALTVPYVLAQINAQDGWITDDSLFIRMHVRYSGYAGRALVFENSRIHEMYKLPDADVMGAMLGIDSTVPYWRAEALEASAYTEVMQYNERLGRDSSMNLPKDLVQDCYGYNAISKKLGDAPVFTRVNSSQTVADVPYGVQTRAVGYEYDAEGVLLGWFSHPAGAVYPVRDFDAKLVEMLAGVNDDLLDEFYGQKSTNLDPGVSYRMYICDIVDGLPTNLWRDVTGSGNYAVVNTKLTWLIDQTKFFTLVRSNKVILAYSLSLPTPDGVLRFSLSHRALRNGIVSRWVMQIPMGELDVFLNGRRLIEGLDYIVRFPQIVVTNKEYLVNPNDPAAEQVVSVRFTGFCKSDLTRETKKDTGFINHGMLSHNNRFDIRDDKVLSISVDGRLYDRSELKFDEGSSSVGVPDQPNGRPYLIRDIIVPLRGYTNKDTYVMRAASQVIDQVVADYMTEKMPVRQFTTPNVIEHRYSVYSPFACMLMNDLRHGILDDDRIKVQFGDDLVFELCQPYEWLLRYDPTQNGLQPDLAYVDVHPHNLGVIVDLDVYDYIFLQRAVHLYLSDRTTLSGFIRIKPNI